MRKIYKQTTLLLACAAVSAGPLSAASFAVPPDRLMVRQATAIVVASALSSRTELRDQKRIETVTAMSVEEVLKGSIEGSTFDLNEPGGVYEHRITMIPGIPRFKDGDRYLLFLIKTSGGWRVLGMMLGKFSFDSDILGHDILIRDTADDPSWDPDHTARIERRRLAEPFLQFIKGTVSGGPPNENYLVPAEPLIGNSGSIQHVFTRHLKPVTLVFTPTSYSSNAGTTAPCTVLAPCGGRWTSFPVTFKFVGTEPGAGGSPAGTTNITSAMANWNGDTNSNVNLVNGGQDVSGLHTGGVSTPDGQNTIAFERDIVNEFGAFPFTCSAGGYSGTFGVGAYSSLGTPHAGPNGEFFNDALEGDVEMALNIANCASPGFFTGDFNSALTHEIGHAIGFRHSDQTRDLASAAACVPTASFECSSSAIMKAYIPSGFNGALQTWDHNAVAAVYPNPTLPAPTSVVATATTATNVQVSWSGSCSTACHVYRSALGTAFSQVAGSPAGSPFNDTTASAGVAYLYKVRAFDGVFESADSNIDLATTVIFTDPTLTVQTTVVKAVHFTELRTAVNAVQTLAGTANTGYTDPTLNTTVTVKKVNVDEPLTRLNAARTTLGLSTITLSGGAITQFTTLIGASDVNDLRTGVR